MGAWIEILKKVLTYIEKWSHPTMGAWIEIPVSWYITLSVS